MDPLTVTLLSLWILLGSGGADHPGEDRAPLASEEPADTDGDGVIDAHDLCGGTPAGYPVLDNGCPADTDGDGIPDGADRCPGTARDAPGVDARGCSGKDRKTEWSHRYIVRSA